MGKIKVQSVNSTNTMQVSVGNSDYAVSVTNNRAQYYSEQAKKYRDEAKISRDEAKYYAEQNSNVTFEYIEGVKNSLVEQINTKQIQGDYALSSDVPTKVSELENDSGFATVVELNQSITENTIDKSLSDITEAGKEVIRRNSYHPSLFQAFWSDYLLNRADMLRADTFSWQDGDTYDLAYSELVNEYDNEASVEETEDSITFKHTPKGYKIADSSQEETILNKYNTDGIAWFYLLDKTNTRFKLPRMRYKYIYATTSGVSSDPSKSGLVADSSDGIQTIEDFYLYFYVGEFAQSALQQTAGINAEMFNGKADVNLNNISSSVKAIDGQWVISTTTLSTATAVGTYTIDLSSYLPNDNYSYEVIFSFEDCLCSKSTLGQIKMNNIICITCNTDSRRGCNCFIYPVVERSITMQIIDAAYNRNNFRVHGYRRIGTNQ